MTDFIADSSIESDDRTADISVTTDGRYYVDPGQQAHSNEMGKIVCDSEHLWLFALHRVYCLPVSPLYERIAFIVDPSTFLERHVYSKVGVTKISGRTATWNTVTLPGPLPFQGPLSRHNLIADKIELAVDDRLGCALQTLWFYQGELLVRAELSDIQENVNDEKFRVEVPPGVRVVTSQNPLAMISPKDAAASVRLFVSDLSSWIRRPRGDRS